MDKKTKLVFLDGDTPVKEVPLDSGEWTLGRSHLCKIQLEDSEVSSQHAVVVVKGDEVWLKDGHSKNGTHLNEKLLQGEASLTPGDIVRIGNTRFRFEAPGGANADFATPPAPGAEVDSESETRFIALPEELDARTLSGEKLGAKTGHDDGTSALPDNATRMLEPSELKGLQASLKVAWDVKKLAAGIVLALAVLIGAVFLAKRSQSPGAEPAMIMETIRDWDGGFELALPGRWRRSGKPDASLVSFNYRDTDGAKAQVEVMKETKAEYEQTGLTTGFNLFLEECKSRHPEFSLLGQKKMEVNDVALLFYAFSSQTGQGKGIYLLDGDCRIVIEGHSSRRDYPAFADLYSTILQSFKLYQPQKYFDFPAPDEAVRLAGPDQAIQQAKDHFLQGKELLRRRDVRLDNLYRAIREFQTSLQFAVTLASRPSVYGQVVEELKYAQQLLNEGVRRQRFEINRAHKEGDWQTAYWEAQKLMQMIPVKTDPIYQEAGAWVKKMSKKER